jgi:hypothetical protein
MVCEISEWVKRSGRSGRKSLSSIVLELSFWDKDDVEINYNLCKKQVNETVWKKLINLILIKKYLRPYFDRQPGRNVFLYS